LGFKQYYYHYHILILIISLNLNSIARSPFDKILLQQGKDIKMSSYTRRLKLFKAAL